MVPMRQDQGPDGAPAGPSGATSSGGAPAEGCVIGIEHEFGVTIDPLEVIGPVLTPGGALMRCSGFGDPVTSPGQYLENGARFYLDCGDHPEYATPECTNPRQLLAADCAGVELVAAMATRAERQLSSRAGRAVRVRVLRNNV